jgi:hypothetical protein
MGWGVPQDGTIAQIVERETGLLALNAGISSYGTVREMRLLDRIDTRRLRYLVIQYCNDDFLETRPFTGHGNTFAVGDRGRYERAVARAVARKRYWPGRRTFELLRDVLAPEERDAPRPATVEEQVRYFVNAVLHAGRTDLSRVQIIAFEISQARRADGRFAEALKREMSDATYPPPIRSLRVLDLSKRLGPADYYDLDDHLRPSGQRAVARAVIEAIRETRPPP